MSELPAASSTSRPLHRSQLFTVRVWLEDLGEGRSEWRGQVQHVLGGETRYFRDWQALVTFIVERSTVARNVDPSR